MTFCRTVKNRTFSSCISTGAACFVVVINLATLAAQDDRYLPKRPVVVQSIPSLPEKSLAAVEGSEEILVDQLQGIMILDHESRIQDPIKPFEGVKIDPAAELSVAREESFKPALQYHLGRPITIHNLNELAQLVVLLYRDAKQPVVDVSIPPGQDITDGIVQIVVTEATIGNVKFRGNCWFDTCDLQQQTWLRKGQRIFEPCLQDELVWLNRSPYRSVGLTLEPGADAGTTDVVFDVSDEQPTRYFTGYENNGPRLTSRDRLFAGFNWGNAGGQDRNLSYQYTTDASLDRTFQGHSLYYEAPIFENRDTWSLYGNWNEINGRVAGLPGANTWQLSGRYRHTLSRSACQLDEFHFGFDAKGLDSDLDYGGTTVVSDDAHLLNLTAGMFSEQKYEGGQTEYALDVFLSPSNLLPNNRSRDLKQLRAGANSAYIYARGYFEKLYCLDQRSDFVIRMTGQLAGDSLIASEQLAFGGFNSIRGYDMWTYNGDNGYIMNAELRSKPIIGCCSGRESVLTLLGFADAGQQFNWESQKGVGIQNGEVLASVGVGLRYLLDDNVSVRCDYGYPLVDTNRPNFNENGRLHFGATLSY